MNYIDQIKGFWITQEMNQLGTSEIAMYFYMLEIWNKTGWIGCFKRNNYKVMADLSIRSIKTLQSIRDRLQTAGILTFRQRNGVANVEYVMNDLSKFYRGSGIGKGIGSIEGSGIGPGIVNINQTRPDQTSKSHSAADASAPREKSAKKQKASSKKNTPAPAAKFWAPLVELWFTFNEEKYGARPTFHGADPRHFRKILDILEQRAINAGLQWTERIAHERLRAFLDIAFKDQWMQQNFLLPHLDKFMDKFILNQQHGNSKISGKAAGRAKTGRGGTIEDLQALKRRPKGPADAGPEPGGLQDHPGGADWTPAEVVE
jgi:hypothetical protein